MKKDTPKETIYSLFDEYMERTSRHGAVVKEIENKISECDKTIEKLTDQINKEISTLTTEEYITLQAEIDKAKKIKEMHEKQLSAVMGSLSGFSNMEDKRNFVSRFKTVYRSEEDEFVRECDKHLQAIDALLMERKLSASKSLDLAQRIGEYNFIVPSNVRQIVARAISARMNVGAYTNK